MLSILYEIQSTYLGYHEIRCTNDNENTRRMIFEIFTNIAVHIYLLHAEMS